MCFGVRQRRVQILTPSLINEVIRGNELLYILSLSSPDCITGIIIITTTSWEYYEDEIRTSMKE